jgi:hypothetical protein
MGLSDQRHIPAALLPRMRRYPLYRRLGEPQGRYGRVWIILAALGFDPLTMLPVAIQMSSFLLEDT